MDGSPGNNTQLQPARLRGAILDGTVQGGEGIIGKAGRERGVFVAWSFFTVMSVRRSSSFLVRVSSTSHSSDDG